MRDLSGELGLWFALPGVRAGQSPARPKAGPIRVSPRFLIGTSLMMPYAAYADGRGGAILLGVLLLWPPALITVAYVCAGRRSLTSSLTDALLSVGISALLWVALDTPIMGVSRSLSHTRP